MLQLCLASEKNGNVSSHPAVKKHHVLVIAVLGDPGVFLLHSAGARGGQRGQRGRRRGWRWWPWPPLDGEV
uniref:Uncharacterized protein n=1 Tax=Arundo donax TaxID=35708 RepID=A0A0A9F795_ARUDO